MADVEIHGDDGNDIITGTELDDLIYGYGGNDRLRGEDGDDVLIGGPGNDWLHGDRGNNTLEGGQGSDWLNVVLADDVVDNLVSGGVGRDSFEITSGTIFSEFTAREVIWYLDGTGTISDGGSFDGIEVLGFQGASGDDVLEAHFAETSQLTARMVGLGTLILDFGATEAPLYMQTDTGAIGDNFLHELVISRVKPAWQNVIDGTWASLTLTGSRGDDWLVATDGTDLIRGGGGDDVFVSRFDPRPDDRDDRFNGQAGNDFFWGHAGTFDGGKGLDVARVALDGTFAITERFEFGQTVDYAIGDVVLRNVEVVAFDETTPNRIETDLTYVFDPVSLTDYRSTPERAAVLGADNLTVDLSALGEDWTVHYGLPAPRGRTLSFKQVDARGWDDVFLASSGTFRFSQGADEIRGTPEQEVFHGEGGDDIFYLGRANGRDKVFGGNGDDLVQEYADGKRDLFVGGSGHDKIAINDYGNRLVLDLAKSANNTGGFAKDVIRGFETVFVNTVSDKSVDLRGTDRGETLFTGRGPDILTGRGGNDVLSSTGRGDTYDGGAGRDTVDFGASTFRSDIFGVIVDLENDRRNALQADNDTLIDIENIIGTLFADEIYGDGGRNALSGGARTDLLDGRGGRDLLEGGSGNDVLIGGAGADRFVFDLRAGDLGTDRIRDFGTGRDTLLLDTGLVGGAGTGAEVVETYGRYLRSADQFKLTLEHGVKIVLEDVADADTVAAAIDFL